MLLCSPSHPLCAVHPRQAAQCFQAALAADPCHPDARTHLADLCRAAGSPEGRAVALAAYQQVRSQGCRLLTASYCHCQRLLPAAHC